MGLLTGRVALITGAAGGIGRAMVDAFRAADARIVACDREAALLGDVPAEHRLAFDLAVPQACEAALGDLTNSLGVPDIVVSNAGYTRAETLETVSDEVWQTELAINLGGARNVTAPLLAPMRRRGSGAFVFISSVNALAHFGNPAYAAAKAGLVAYARAIATECGRDGIRANTICPGSVRTPIWDRRVARDPNTMDRIAALYPLGRIVMPREVADAAVFLASPLASGITGVTLPVDCGLMAGNLPFIAAIT